MKKVLCFILASTLVLSFSACNFQKENSKEKSQATGEEQSSSEAGEENSLETSTDEESSGTKPADEMKSIFATDDAENVIVTDGVIEYTSNMSYDEIKEFLKNAIVEIGGVKTTEVENTVGVITYTWVGTDSEGIDVTLSVVANVASGEGWLVIATHGVAPAV